MPSCRTCAASTTKSLPKFPAATGSAWHSTPSRSPSEPSGPSGSCFDAVQGRHNATVPVGVLFGILGCLICGEDCRHLRRNAERRSLHASTVNGGQHWVDAVSDDAVLLQIARYTRRGEGEASEHAVVFVATERVDVLPVDGPAANCGNPDDIRLLTSFSFEPVEERSDAGG